MKPSDKLSEKLLKALIEIESAIDAIESADQDAHSAAFDGVINKDRVYSWDLLSAQEALEQAKELIAQAQKELQDDRR